MKSYAMGKYVLPKTVLQAKHKVRVKNSQSLESVCKAAIAASNY